ncbi:MAG: hypothetical protein ACLVAU_13630 [Ruminococcus sp.]
MDSLKIGNIELSKDFLKNSNLFISDVIYRYEKMDDHLEDYNMSYREMCWITLIKIMQANLYLITLKI